jgi:hypothetical protein
MNKEVQKKLLLVEKDMKAFGKLIRMIDYFVFENVFSLALYQWECARWLILQSSFFFLEISRL